MSYDVICSTDKMSEVAILEVIKKNFEDHFILGEEGGITGNTSSDYLWCVDPLGLSLSSLGFLSKAVYMVIFYKN